MNSLDSTTSSFSTTSAGSICNLSSSKHPSILFGSPEATAKLLPIMHRHKKGQREVLFQIRPSSYCFADASKNDLRYVTRQQTLWLSLVFLDLLHFTAEDSQPGIFPMEFGLFLMLCLYRDKSRKFKVLMPFSIMITVLMPMQFGALTQTTVTKIWQKLTRTFHLHRNKWTIFGPVATYRLLNPANFSCNILLNAAIFTNKTTMYKHLH